MDIQQIIPRNKSIGAQGQIIILSNSERPQKGNPGAALRSLERSPEPSGGTKTSLHSWTRGLQGHPGCKLR